MQRSLKQNREFILLAVLGADLPGALTVLPADQRSAFFESHGVKSNVRPEEPGTMFRFSPAGVQLKFSAVTEAAAGRRISAEGKGGSWIVRLPSSRFPAEPENEFAMMALARAVGLDVPQTELIDIGLIRGLPSDLGTFSGSAFAIRRFGRDENGKAVHMEDFAQVFGLYT